MRSDLGDGRDLHRRERRPEDDVAGLHVPATRAPRPSLDGATVLVDDEPDVVHAGPDSRLDTVVDDGSALAADEGEVARAVLRHVTAPSAAATPRSAAGPSPGDAGVKERAILDRFGCSAASHWQRLNALIDRLGALAAEPIVVHRLRRLRTARMPSARQPAKVDIW